MPPLETHEVRAAINDGAKVIAEALRGTIEARDNKDHDLLVEMRAIMMLQKESFERYREDQIAHNASVKQTAEKAHHRIDELRKDFVTDSNNMGKAIGEKIDSQSKELELKIDTQGKETTRQFWMIIGVGAVAFMGMCGTLIVNNNKQMEKYSKTKAQIYQEIMEDVYPSRKAVTQ